MRSLIASAGSKQPWVRRLTLPAYQVQEAARYANVTSQTILNWQKQQAGGNAAILNRDDGQALSYLQLIEVAVVAAMRSAGVSLAKIRDAKEYMGQRLKSEYPFAQHEFKTDGTNILMDLSSFDQGESKDKLIVVSKGGQLGWKPILEQRLKEFEYHKGIAAKWRLKDKISIDPQVAFGAPSINGTPTWTIKGRLNAGETIEEIAYDFSLDSDDVVRALEFEGVDIKTNGAAKWRH